MMNMKLLAVVTPPSIHQNGGINSNMRGMSHVNVDLGVFQEEKFTKGIYTKESGGYWATVSEAPIQHNGGVAMFYCNVKHFTLEALCLHGPNVFIFQIVLGGQRRYVVGCYLSPYDTSTIEAVVASIIQHPRGEELILALYFNGDLSSP